jgi:hypothetical protein
VPVLMPLAPASTLLERAPDAIASMLRRLGAEETLVDAERSAMRDARIGPTNDPRAVGVMNGFAFHAEIRWHEGGRSLEDIAVELAGIPIGPLRVRTGFPYSELAAVLGHQPVERPRRRRTPTPGTGLAAVGRMLQLKVTLKGTKPPVWRRVLVDASTTLDHLHEVIQAAFGWWNYHLYEFEIGRTRYAIPDDEWDFGPPTSDARRTHLDLIATVDTSFTYTYDFGDDWEHAVVVERVVDGVPLAGLPACTDGRRAAPPEDSGGPGGYEQFLKVISDRSHPEHDQMVQWAGGWGGGRFDPEWFDPAEFGPNLQSLHATRFDP